MLPAPVKLLTNVTLSIQRRSLTIFVVGSCNWLFLKRWKNVDIDLVVVFTAPWNFANHLPMFCAESHFTKNKDNFQYILTHAVFLIFLQNLVSSVSCCLFQKLGGKKFGFELWTHMEDNIVHVALGKSVKEYKPMLAWAVWALKDSGGKSICVIHVHQPAKMIPMSKLSIFVGFTRVHKCLANW